MSVADEIRGKQKSKAVTVRELTPASVADSIRQKIYDTYTRQKAEYDEFIQDRGKIRPANAMSAQEALKQKKNMTQQDIAAASMQMQGIKPEPETKPFLLANNDTAGGYLVNRFEQGLTSAAYGMQKTQQLINPKMRPRSPYDAYIQKKLEDKRYEARVQTAQAGQSKSKLVQRLGNVAEGIGQQIPNIMLNYASGGAAQFMTAFSAASQAIGNSYEAAKREGADDKQALTYGVAAGLLEGAIEVISGGVPGMKGALDAPIDALTKNVKNRFLKVIAKQGLNALGEGVEEMITQSLDPFIKQATYDPNAKFSTKDVLNAGFDGFLTSVFMMGAPTAIELRQTGQINQQAQKYANLYTIDNQALAAEMIANGTQQGKAYQMLQEKPVSEMTTDEQVAFIEQVQEELGIKEVNQYPIKAGGSGITFTEEQAKDFVPVEPSKIDSVIPNAQIEKTKKLTLDDFVKDIVTAPANDGGVRTLHDGRHLVISKKSDGTFSVSITVHPSEEAGFQPVAFEQSGLKTEDDAVAVAAIYATKSQRPSRIDSEPQQTANENVPMSEVKTDAGQAQQASTQAERTSYPSTKAYDGNPLFKDETAKMINTKNGYYHVQISDYSFGDKRIRISKGGNLLSETSFKNENIASDFVNKFLDAEEGKISKDELLDFYVMAREKDGKGKIEVYSAKTNNEQQAIETLPDTEQELSAMVNKMEEQQKQGMEIDLQLFAEAKDKLQKISQFRTNTLERTQKLTDKEREMLDPELFGYDPENVDEWRSEAEYDVENAYELTKRRIESATAINGGVQAYEAALITQKMLEKARQTGDYAELKEWLPKVAEKTREAARALTATRYAYDPKSPAAAIVEVQRMVDNVNKEIADTEPQIKTDKKKIKDGVKKAQREAGEKVARDIETLSPEELLARRIQAHLNEATDAENDPIKDMVNELYRIAQESPLPDNKTASKRDPMEFVTQAVKNRDQYTEVFDKAKEIVQEKFKDNPEALELLDAYFAKEAVPVISKIRLNTAVKNVIKNMGTTIERIAKSGRRTKTEIFKTLATEFITKGKLEQDEAQYLVPFLVDAYDAQVKERAQQILGNMLKTPTKTKGVPFAERIKEIINMGVANEDAMNRVLSDKYNLPKLDDQTIQDILDIYDTVDSNKFKEIKELIVNESKLEGKKAEALRKELDKTETSRYKAIAMGQVMKRFTDRQQVTVWRKLSTLQAMKHLLNFVTPSRNWGSNTSLRGLEKVSETISSSIWKKYTKAGLRYSDTAKAKAKAEAQHEKVDIMLGIRSRGQEQTKYDTYRGQTFKKGILSKAEKLMSKTLRVNDVYNSELRKQDSLENMTALNGGYVTKEIQAESEYEGKFATFNDDSLPARILNGIGRVLSTVGVGKSKGLLGPADFSLKDLVIKYSRVPGNVIARTLEYSPLGYLKSIYGFYQASRSANNEFTMKRRAALAFGRATTGTGLMALGALMYSLGLFVQRKPDEEKGEAALSRAMGLNQGQVNISALGRAITGGSTKPKDGDLLVSISALEPFATTITAGASIKQSIDEGKTFGESVNIATENAFEEMLDMPTMAIIQAMWQESQREGSNFWTVATVPAVKAIPGFISQPTRAIAKAVDPVARSTSGKTVYERTLKETMRNIPLLSTLLEPQVDPTGEEYKNLAGEPLTSLLNYLLNPGYATIYKDIPYKDKLRKLSQTFPDANLWPRYYAIDSVDGKKLTDEEKTVYMKAFGQYYNKEFERMLKYINVNKLSKNDMQKLIYGTDDTEGLEDIRKKALTVGREAVINYRKKKK